MPHQKEGPVMVSSQALHRMPYYLQYLKQLQDEGVPSVAAPAIAANLGLNDVQVRKDLAAISPTKGKPRSGFLVRELIYHMEDFLGYHQKDNAVLAGVGSLGKALLSYKDFEQYGLKIVTAFDVDETIIGTEVLGKKVLPALKISNICRRLKIPIGIIAVPSEQAQIVCDQLVAGGVRAIWNFAPVHLSAPEQVMVQDENMAATVSMLLKHIQNSAREAQL